MRTQHIGAATVHDTRRLRPWSDWAHEAVDTIGLIPGLNIPAEIVSGALSLYMRDYIGFGCRRMEETIGPSRAYGLL